MSGDEVEFEFEYETPFVIEMPETRQHFFYFFTIFSSRARIPPHSCDRNSSVTRSALFSTNWQSRCSAAQYIIECLPTSRRGGAIHPVPSNAALPPDICAFSESLCHRLEDKPIHLRVRPL